MDPDPEIETASMLISFPSLCSKTKALEADIEAKTPVDSEYVLI